MYSGGTLATVYGRYLDSVAAPRITLIVVTTRFNDTTSASDWEVNLAGCSSLMCEFCLHVIIVSERSVLAIFFTASNWSDDKIVQVTDGAIALQLTVGDKGRWGNLTRYWFKAPLTDDITGKHINMYAMLWWLIAYHFLNIFSGFDVLITACRH